MTEHVLKTDRAYFQAVFDGRKPFDVRANDRGFQAGDTVVLVEPVDWSSGLEECYRHPCTSHRHRTITTEVTYVYAGDPRRLFGGVEPGHVVLGFGKLAQNRSQEEEK